MAEPRSFNKTKDFHLTIPSPHFVPGATRPKSLELWYKIKVLHSVVTFCFEIFLRWLIFSFPGRNECCPLLQCIFPHLTSLKERENILRLGTRKQNFIEMRLAIKWPGHFSLDPPSLINRLQKHQEKQGERLDKVLTLGTLMSRWRCKMIVFLCSAVILTNQY